MAISKRSKLIVALGAIVVMAGACGGDDGKKSGSTTTPGNGTSTPAAGAVGKACANDTQCGTGASCSQTQSLGALGTLLGLVGIQPATAPGGYCTASCTGDTQCGDGGVCLGALLGLSGECRQSCSSASDCRTGYECAMQADIPTDAGLSTAQLAAANALRLPSQCQAAPTPNVLAAGQTGVACTVPTDGGVASECQPGFCGGASCSGVCSDDSTCGTGGACVANGFYGSTGTCQQSCTVDTDCKLFKPNNNVGCIKAGTKMICGAKVYPLAANAAGKACKVDSDCGSTGTCATAIGLRQTPAPDGYCTQIGCASDTDCGGGACIGAALAAACYATCTADANCRAGYVCQSSRDISGATVSVCTVDPTAAAADAGTPPTVSVDAGTPTPTTTDDAGSDAGV